MKRDDELSLPFLSVKSILRRKVVAFKKSSKANKVDELDPPLRERKVGTEDRRV